MAILTEQDRMAAELAQFRHLCEYGYPVSYKKESTPAVIGEAGEDENQPANPADNQGKNDTLPAPGDAAATQGGDATPVPPQPGDDMGQGAMEQPVEEPVDANGIPELNAEDVPSLDDDTTTEQPGDTVIDVDDLTKAQEKINNKANAIGTDVVDVSDKINKLATAIDDVLNKLESNNSDIENLRSEFEKRNPTETEKLQLRYKDSYPFNVNPDTYFDNKDNGKDEQEEEKQQYEIHQSDIEDAVDDPTIAKSFDEEFDEAYHYDMARILEWNSNGDPESPAQKEEYLQAKSAIGKMIVYHFSNGSGTTGIRVDSVSRISSGNFIFVDVDGSRGVEIADVHSLIHHAPRAPKASLYLTNGETLDSNGFAVLA